MKALGYATAFVLSPLVFGFTLSVLWGWFMVPLGVRAITLAHAYGLLTLATVLRPSSLSKEQRDKPVGERFAEIVSLCLVALLFGYIASRFM